MALHFNKKHTQLLSEQEAVTKALQGIVNTPTVQVMVDGIRPLPDDWYMFVACIQFNHLLLLIDIPCCSFSVCKG